MHKVLRYTDKIYKLVWRNAAFFFSWVLTYLKFKMNGVSGAKNFRSGGVPIINVNLQGKFEIGENLRLNNGKYFNMIGRQQSCYFIVGKGGKLSIGDYVGISSTAIVCWNQVKIGNHVKIGGGVVIYDTDFHSLSAAERMAEIENTDKIKTAPVSIGDHVFIGSHSIILKGVQIGNNVVIGAGSVVTRPIPDNEIWGGNPAKFIKNI